MATRQLTGFNVEMHRLRTAHRDGLAPLVIDGKFSSTGIMREAVRIARQCRAPGLSWAVRMKIGLTTAWRKAKVTMAAVTAAASAPQPAPAPRTALAHVARRPARSYGWDRGVRAVVNGW